MPTKFKRKAIAYATAVEIYCPVCIAGNSYADPIPAPDGSFMWDRLPDTVTCMVCKETFNVAEKIRMG